MHLAYTGEQTATRAAVEDNCRPFNDDHWLRKDRDGGFQEESLRAMANAGWLGIAMPAAQGGAGLGFSEAALMMEVVLGSGAGLSGASAIHMNVFGMNPAVGHDSDAQKARWLPPIIQGEHKACFGVTEPHTGPNTLKLKTFARRVGDRYVVNGQKVWISTAQVAHKIMLLARTTPIDEDSAPTQGLSLFCTDLDRRKIAVREIEKMGRKAVDSNQLFVDGMEIPVEDRVGEEGPRDRQRPGGGDRRQQSQQRPGRADGGRDRRRRWHRIGRHRPRRRLAGGAAHRAAGAGPVRQDRRRRQRRRQPARRAVPQAVGGRLRRCHRGPPQRQLERLASSGTALQGPKGRHERRLGAHDLYLGPDRQPLPSQLPGSQKWRRRAVVRVNDRARNRPSGRGRAGTCRRRWLCRSRSRGRRRPAASPQAR